MARLESKDMAAALSRAKRHLKLAISTLEEANVELKEAKLDTKRKKTPSWIRPNHSEFISVCNAVQNHRQWPKGQGNKARPYLFVLSEKSGRH